MSKQDLEIHAFSSRLEYYNDLIFMSVQESTMAVSAHLTLLEFSQRLWKLNANSLISVLATSHRIDFKLLLVVYKSPNGLAPKYISQFPLPSRPLRSSGKGLLTVPRKKKKNIVKLDLDIADLSVWKTEELLCSLVPLIETYTVWDLQLYK